MGIGEKILEELANKMLHQLEADTLKAIYGSTVPAPATMLRVTKSGCLEVVPVDYVWRCPKCGPVFQCAEHAAMVV